MEYECNLYQLISSYSLDYHAKTFSICGAMNNLLIVVIPYTGDVSEVASREIAKVFGVMAGSDSTQVCHCIIHQSGLRLPFVDILLYSCIL